MTSPTMPGHRAARLTCGIVVRAGEDSCEVIREGRVRTVGYARQFPSPRAERVSPGHLVAVTATPDGTAVVVWRWYDAVILGEDGSLVRMWEPAHGDVAAQQRRPRHRQPGTRAYLSAGLPGATWWVAGQAAARAEDADVELAEVDRFYSEHGLWDSIT